MRELTIVSNVMNVREAEVLECARDYSVRKYSDGHVEGRFKNSGSEEWAVKLTLTALLPSTRFEIKNGESLPEYKKANRAGVLETKIVIPANRMMTIREIKE